MALIEKCVCGAADFVGIERIHLQCRVCAKCGLTHQVVEMGPKEYRAYYTKQYPTRRDVTYGQDHHHKAEVAKKRFDSYHLHAGMSLLDIGTGDGSFVDACRINQLDAWGCEIAIGYVSTKCCYPGDLRGCRFPTEHFDVVTIHDVLEHMLDPVSEMEEMFRILKPGGRLLVEIPHFWGSAEESAHHYKAIEHLWFFRDRYVEDLGRQVGFAPVGTSRPIPSKLLLDFARPAVKRTTILVPPGIGDSYWSLVKLQSFCGALGVGVPDVLISSLDKDKDRSLDYIRRAPFVNAAGYLRHKGSESWRPVWSEAYMRNGRSVFKNVEGCDYFVAYNGVLRNGRTLEEVDGYVSDWLFPMWESMPEIWYGQDSVNSFGRYVLAYFVPHGMYSRWLRHMGPAMIVEFLTKLASRLDARIILIGGKWDVDTDLHKELRRRMPKEICTDLTGQTTLEECFGMMRRATAVTGFPSGMTMMGTVFRVPTFMFWHKYFDSRFWWNACAPESRHQWYDIVDVMDPSAPEKAISSIAAMASGDSLQRSAVSGAVLAEKIAEDAKPLTVACVLKSGGPYDATYVERLRSMVAKHLTIPYRFVCLSDVEVPVERVPLNDNLPGWWSKLELFRPGVLEPPVLFFDLDTIIIDSIDALAIAVRQERFMMLRSFRAAGRFGSGVMGWREDMSDIYRAFQPEMPQTIERWNSLSRVARQRKMREQVFIQDTLAGHWELIPVPVQTVVQVASYKHDCAEKRRPPRGTAIVCFHGRPRPHEVTDLWVTQAWQ